uniref:Uncharacterized protein n=1 Tax=Vespula pensylvanica TaxID=30213 RepID=A0A834P6M8_VESPE|nr:hypothetical protein H0235_006352 [Vespula pensylvanica]
MRNTNYWFSLASNIDEYTSQFSQYAFSAINREELIYWFSLVLNFDEWASQFSKYAFSVSNKEELIITSRSGDTFPPVTTTKFELRPTLTVTGSVLLQISTSRHRSSHSTHSPQLIEKT